MSLREVIAAKARVSRPGWLPNNMCYETIMGSESYGVASDLSDVDVYGIRFSSKESVFPHLAGEIFGFGPQIQRFEQWQEHHVAALDKTWDFQVFGIVKFFQLAMETTRTSSTHCSPRVGACSPRRQWASTSANIAATFCTRVRGTSSRATPIVN